VHLTLDDAKEVARDVLRARVALDVHLDVDARLTPGDRLEAAAGVKQPLVAYAKMHPLKFSALNLVSAFAWAGTIMLFVKSGSKTLGAMGLDVWWGPFIPAILVVIFFRWLSSKGSR